MSSPCTRLARWSPSPARTICRKQTTWCSVGGVILGFTKAPTSGHTAFTGMTDRTIIFHFVWHYVICVCVCVCVGGCTCIGKLSSEPPDFHHGFIPQTVVLAKLGSTTSKFTSTNRTWCQKFGITPINILDVNIRFWTIIWPHWPFPQFIAQYCPVV